MIQILGLRDFTTPTGEVRKYETFFHKKWRAPSVTWLMHHLDEALTSIEGAERFNLFYTAAICKEEEGRKFESQSIIPFDIDGIDVGKAELYPPQIAKALGVSLDTITCIMSGHGVQFLIESETPFHDPIYFESAKPFYRLACEAITKRLQDANLKGVVDVSIWTAGRLLRLPCTMNIKQGREPVEAIFLVNNIRPIPWALTSAFKLSQEHLEAVANEAVSEAAMSKIKYFDTEGVMNECEFIKWSAANPSKVTEPQWYAGLSVVSRLPDGRKLCHDLSSGYSGYSYDETELKIDQAIARSGPRTCESISKIFDGCSHCKHYKRVISPISIKGDTYIATMDTGFFFIKEDAQGVPKPYKPDFDGLRRYFMQKHEYISAYTGNVYVYNGTHWEIMPDALIEAFALEHFKPFATDSVRVEFRKLLQRTNLKNDDFFTPQLYLNLSNGVLNVKTLELTPHSSTYGFTYCLPFNYDKEARAPRFFKFLEEVTCGDAQTQSVLEEYMGYVVGNIDPSMHEKCLILVGTGSNGKSVFIDTVKALVGQRNYSVLTMEELKKDTNRHNLINKLLNVAEETPYKSLTDSSMFKNLITGGEVTVKELYKQPYRIRSRAKFMFACNDLPLTYDPSDGMFRRLLIVNFKASFFKSKRDLLLRDKLNAELPGIFNIAVAGLLRLLENKDFTQASAVLDSIEEYRMSMDSVRQWVDDSVDFDPDCLTDINKLFSDYTFYCEERKCSQVTLVKLMKRITEINPNLERTRALKGNRRVTAIKGIRLLTGGSNF